MKMEIKTFEDYVAAMLADAKAIKERHRGERNTEGVVKKSPPDPTMDARIIKLVEKSPGIIASELASALRVIEGTMHTRLQNLRRRGALKSVRALQPNGRQAQGYFPKGYDTSGIKAQGASEEIIDLITLQPGITSHEIMSSVEIDAATFRNRLKHARRILSRKGLRIVTLPGAPKGAKRFQIEEILK